MMVEKAGKIDLVFDCQRIFRNILQAMARPGLIQPLEFGGLDEVRGLCPAGVAIALSLLDKEVSFCYWEVTGESQGEYSDASRFITLYTGSRQDTPASADFLFGWGYDVTLPLANLKRGLPAYPEQGATAVIQVTELTQGKSSGRHDEPVVQVTGLTHGQPPNESVVAMTLEGPGILGQSNLWVTGLLPKHLSVWQEVNGEFPLGIDVLLVTPGGQVAGIPRSTNFTWEVIN
ncbi:MAG: phosphonate C-P lyase system protein PhnH [Thermincolia bacterium]